MHYIAILDYHHLDHSFFMKSFAEAMSRQKGCSGIILHGDSPYTNRLMQTGMMREDAVIRSTKDLNHRIVALLADNGVSGIGINGFQREIVRQADDQLTVNHKWIEDRPAGTHLVLSNLVWNPDHRSIVPIPLNVLAGSLLRETGREYLLVFPEEAEEGFDLFVQDPGNSGINSRGKSEFNSKSTHQIPDNLKPLPEKSYFCTLSAFEKLPDTAELQIISG